jgi:hypothetical protein
LAHTAHILLVLLCAQFFVRCADVLSALCAGACVCVCPAGGWAGGEAALLQLREQLQREKAAKKAVNSAVSSSSSAKVQPPPPKDGKAPIYIGYSKE